MKSSSGLAALLVPSALVTLVPAALAGSASTTLTVTAEVATECTINPGQQVAFGTITSAAATDTQGSVVVTCTFDSATSVGIDQGTNPGAASTPDNPDRQMSNGSTAFIPYGLFRDAARTQAWGDVGTANAHAVNVTANTPTTIDVFARTIAPVGAPTGQYQDVTVVTVLF